MRIRASNSRSVGRCRLSLLACAIAATVPPLHARAQVAALPSGQVASELSLTRVAGVVRGNYFFTATDNYENRPGVGVPLGGLHGVATDPNGRYVYVTDTSTSTVRQFDVITGRMTTIAGVPGQSGFSGDGAAATQAKLNQPSSIVIDAAGALYIADTGNHCIRRVTPGGTIITVAGNPLSAGDANGPAGSNQLSGPNSLTLDPLGNLVIGDEANGTIRLYSPATGTLTTLVNSSTTGLPSNFHPRGLAYIPAGLVISDFYNHKLLIFDGAQISTYAGTGTSQSGSAYIGNNGPKESASFSNTWALQYDAAHGTLNVVDGLYLRQIAVTSAADFPLGTIRVIAGLGANFGGPDTIKVPGNHAVNGQGSTPPGLSAVAMMNGDYYLVGGYDHFLSDNGLGLGSIVRLSREDGTVLSRFYTSGSPRISFQLPAGSVWDTVKYNGPDYGGFPTVAYFDQDSCDTGTAYNTTKLCIPIVTPYQISDGAGIQNGYVRVTTHVGNNSATTDFGVVMEGSKNTGVILPQSSLSTDLSTLTSSNGASYTNAAGVSTTLDGKALIADRGGNQVYRVDGTTLTLLAGSSAKTAGYTGDGGSPLAATLNGPAAVLQVPRNWFYIADTNNHVVRVVDPVLNTIRTVVGNGTAGVQQDNAVAIATQMKSPVALAVRRNGAVLIADVDGNTVSSYDPRTGSVTVIAGNGTAAHTGDGGLAHLASVNAPDAVAVGPNDEIYIAERDGHSIRRIDPLTGAITTFAGSVNGDAGNSGDYTSAPLAARFSAPGALFVERSGAVVVADMGNGRMRYITQPTGAGTQTPTVLPYLSDTTTSLRSADRGFVLNGKMLLAPTGAGFLSFKTPGTQLLTVVDNGADQPDFPVSYSSHVLNSGSANYSFTNSLTGNTYPACDSFSQGIRTGEACQWGITFAPSTPSLTYPGAGTVGDSYASISAVRVPFTLNGVPPAPALQFAASPLAAAMKNQTYTATAGTLSAGTAPYVSIQVLSGVMPAGLVASLNGANVILSGTPTVAGTFSFTLQATDSVSMTASQAFNLQVQNVTEVTVHETLHVSDVASGSAAVTIPVNENIHVTDQVSATAARLVSINEAVHVADTVSASAALKVPVLETIHVSDVVAPASAPTVSVTEAIHVNDAPATQTSATIAFSVPNHVYGDAPFAVSATSASPGAFTYAVVSGPATLTGNTVTLTGVGTVVLSASQAASGPYSAGAAQASFTVVAAGTTTTVTTSATPATENTPVTFTATVTAKAVATPTGNVQFRDGDTILQTVALANGTAQYTTSALQTGTHTITAAYQGSSVASASSGSVTQVISAYIPFLLTNNGTGLYQVVIPKGSTAQTPITIMPGSLFNGTISMSCSGLPANVTCEFTPPSLTFAGGSGAQTTQMVIRTSTTKTASATPADTAERITLALLAPSLLLAGLGSSRRRLRSSLYLSLTLTALGLCSTVVLSGCGSSTPQSTTTTTTASPGTYTFSVVATSGATTATLPVTLTVQ